MAHSLGHLQTAERGEHGKLLQTGLPLFGQLGLFFEVGGVDFGKFLHIFRQFINLVDGLALANRDAGATVDAGLWVNVKLGDVVHIRLIRGGMNGNRLTNIKTKQVFRTVVGDYSKSRHEIISLKADGILYHKSARQFPALPGQKSEFLIPLITVW
jgi:hypothetical protein